MRDLCTLSFGGAVYAVDLAHLREVIEPMPSTPVPLSTGEVRGIINLRGELMPVFALDPWLGIEGNDSQIERRPWMAVLQVRSRFFGVLVEQVGTAHVEPEDVESERDSRFEGIVKTQGLRLLQIEDCLRKIEGGLGRRQNQTTDSNTLITA